MYLPSDNIQTFPTVNSRDNGKLLLEENMYNTVRRITKLNYVYEVNGEDPRDTDINMSLKEDDENSTYHIGIKISTPFKCNIHGYDIQINEGFDIIFKDYSSSEEKNDPRYVYITDNNYGQNKPFGLVLSRVISTQRLKGDSLFNITDNNDSKTEYYYRGVMILYGDDFEAANDDIKLKLGTVSIFKRSDNNVNVIGLVIDYNTLIIDGSTVGIKQGDNYISLTEYLNNDYVSKLGDTYHDKRYNIPANISDLSDSEKELIDNSNNKQPKRTFMNGIEYYIPPFFNPYSDNSSVSLIERRSDMYGSLTFRKFDNSTNYEISIGCDNQNYNENEIDINNPCVNNPYITDSRYNPLRGIKLRTSSKSGEGPRDYMDIGLFNIYNYTKVSHVQDPLTALGFNKLVIGETDDTEEYGSQHFYTEDDEIDIGSGTSKVCISVGENTPTWQKCHEFFHSEDNQKFGTIFNEDKVEFIYNKNSGIQITCNEEKSEIGFGDEESTKAMMIDYDLEHSDLSVNNKLGSIGVLKFCDGQCVDNNSVYSSNPGTNDPPHSFKDLSYNYDDEYVPNNFSKIINGYTSTSKRYYYLNPNTYLKNFIMEKNNDYTVVTIDSALNQSLLTHMESNYGWHVYKNGDFLPGHGAFDTTYDGNDEKINDSYNPSELNYQYLSRCNGDKHTINTYDYYCSRYKIDPSAYGKYLLISNMQEIIQTIQDSDIIEDDKNSINPDNINVYFCRTYHDGDTNTIKFGFDRKPTINDISNKKYEDNVNTYTLIGSIKTYDKITGVSNGILNHFIQIPTDISDNDDLFVIFSTTVLSFNTYYPTDTPSISVKNQKRLNYRSIHSPSNTPDAHHTIRGEYPVLGHYNGVHLGVVDNINDSQVVIQKSDLQKISSNRYKDINYHKLLIPDNLENSLYVYSIYKNSNTNNYNYRLSMTYYDYETSKYYKSLRIHGFYSAAQTENTEEGNHNSGTPTNFKYYRLVYALGFETSDIIIEKIKVYFNNSTDLIDLYKLYRTDGKNIKFSAKNPSFNNNLNTGPYPFNKKYFYINNLNLNNITGTDVFFLGTNIDYSDESNIISENYKDDFLCSEFYKQDNNNQYITHHTSKDYRIDDVYHNKWWFIKDLFITNISAINFSTTQNRFNVNVDSYLNETTYVNKLMFGKDEDLNISMSNKQVRFVFPEDENNYKPITFDNNGITFSNHGDYSEKDVTISKVKEGTFDGLNVSGDFRADRVFNAVYNDYADNVKCSKVTEYEPGDIICKDPYSDEYVLSNSDLKRLVVGVYSDTYGHLLGGDKNESMEENSKKYVPIAVAGNVRVKVTGFIQVGDLIRASNIPGVGEKALSPELGTIIGKALESKDDDYYGVKRILMQVMLL